MRTTRCSHEASQRRSSEECRLSAPGWLVGQRASLRSRKRLRKAMPVRATRRKCVGEVAQDARHRKERLVAATRTSGTRLAAIVLSLTTSGGEARRRKTMRIAKEKRAQQHGAIVVPRRRTPVCDACAPKSEQKHPSLSQEDDSQPSAPRLRQFASGTQRLTMMFKARSARSSPTHDSGPHLTSSWGCASILPDRRTRCAAPTRLRAGRRAPMIPATTASAATR